MRLLLLSPLFFAPHALKINPMHLELSDKRLNKTQNNFADYSSAKVATIGSSESSTSASSDPCCIRKIGSKGVYWPWSSPEIKPTHTGVEFQNAEYDVQGTDHDNAVRRAEKCAEWVTSDWRDGYIQFFGMFQFGTTFRCVGWRHASVTIPVHFNDNRTDQWQGSDQYFGLSGPKGQWDVSLSTSGECDANCADNIPVSDQISPTTTTPAPTPTAAPTPVPAKAPKIGGTGDNIPVSDQISPKAPTIGGTGDPHMRNINGDRFDVFRTGLAPLIKVPPSTAALLKVNGWIENLYSKHACDFHGYFTSFSLSGDWVSKNVTVSRNMGETDQDLSIFVDGRQIAYTASFFHWPEDANSKMRIQKTRRGLELQIDELRIRIIPAAVQSRSIKYFDINVVGLDNIARSLGVGGLLGTDDPSFWAQNEACETQLEIPRSSASQFVGGSRAFASMTASDHEHDFDGAHT